MTAVKLANGAGRWLDADAATLLALVVPAIRSWWWTQGVKCRHSSSTLVDPRRGRARPVPPPAVPIRFLELRAVLPRPERFTQAPPVDVT
jgi:hypothetical protein